MKQSQVNKSLRQIPGVGLSISQDLVNIGIQDIEGLIDKDPGELYDLSNAYAGCIQDRCLLYVFRCAVYYASTPQSDHETEKLKWWNWKDQPAK